MANLPSSAPPKRARTSPLKFLREVMREGKKVTWTGRRELIYTSIMVFILVVLAALFFLAVDAVINTVIRFLLGVFG